MFSFPNSDHLIFSREFGFCLFINYTYKCTCLRQHLKETVLWGTITFWNGKTKHTRYKGIFMPLLFVSWAALLVYAACINSLFLICQRSKKWSITGFPSSLHFWGYSSFIHFAIWVCQSEMKALIIMAVPRRSANAFWWPVNSIAELFPVWFV